MANFVRVAELGEVTESKPKAVKVEGHSIALFKHEGDIYATDNQCPHMGYPLTRGRVRNGVLTCDWHGWSYDMGGGGCFTGGCDDLDTYPVKVEDGDIFIDVGGAGAGRDDAHFLLFKEGLMSGDNWTLSKAIAILLARGVSEEETLNLLVRHMGRHVATELDAREGGRQLALMVNGIKVARHYPADDRLIPLMMTASGAAGRAGDRPSVQALPEPMTWEKVVCWVGVFSEDKQWQGIEKCLITARRRGGHDDELIPLLYQCAVRPYFLGHGDNLLHLAYLAEALEEFGWETAEELVCNLGAKMLGRGRGAPRDVLLEGVEKLSDIEDLIEALESERPEGGEFDENALVAGLVSGEVDQTFGAVTEALRAGVGIDQIVTAMVMLAGDRMARTPVGMSPGWGGLSREMELAAAVRTAERYGGFAVGARALYHAAWQFFDDRWLNIAPRPLGESQSEVKLAAESEEAAVAAVLDAIESIRVREVGRLVREYLNAGFAAERLLMELGQAILKDDNGWNLLHALRTVFDEWERCAGHPGRNQLLVGLARWATDVRRRVGSQSAVQTAQRFARGETAVELYE